VTPTIGSLFSGIGGLELGLERAGLGRVAWQAEIDPFCRAVLAKHWPDAVRFSDVKEVGRGTARVDFICGGFPCQDVSLAGKRAGLDGARSGLWSEYARVISELEPKAVVIENVLGLRTLGLRRVLSDLADLGFDAEWSDLAASDVGAPHRRRRLFIVATHPDRINVREQPGWLERAFRQTASESLDACEHGPLADADVQERRRFFRPWEFQAHGDGYGRPLADAQREPLRDAARENAEREVAEREMPRRIGACGAASDPSGERSGARRGIAHGACPGEGGERSGDSRAARDRGGPPHANGPGKSQPGRSLSDQWRRTGDGSWWPPVSPVRRVDDGIPNRSHGRRLKALGNAVVVQCAEVVGRALMDACGMSRAAMEAA